MKEVFIVIGAMGHIGYNVVLELIKQNKKVKVLLHTRKNEIALPKEVEVYYGDITKEKTLKEIFKIDKKSITYVIHSASIKNILDDKLESTNIKGLENVINLCQSEKIDKLIYLGEILTNNSNFNNRYINSKRKANDILLNACRNGLNASIVMPSLTIGENNYRYSLGNNFINSYINNQIKYGLDGNINLIDVKDVSIGIISAALYGKSGEIYYLSGNNYKVEEIFKMIDKIINKKNINKYLNVKKVKKINFLLKPIYKLFHKEIIYNDYLLNHLNLKINSKLSKEELDFKNKDIKETLKKTIKYLNK